MPRKADIKRKTGETDVNVKLDIDGKGTYKIDTSVPFLNHMLELFGKHGTFDLTVKAKGDTKVDYHHTVEDVGIVLGQAFKKALGNMKGIKRYGSFKVPMDETLAEVVVDISGRPGIVYNVDLPKGKVGEFDVELVHDFMKAFVNNAGMTMHINLMYGDNLHHIIEAIFKAAARAMDEATSLDPRSESIPSTKGVL